MIEYEEILAQFQNLIALVPTCNNLLVSGVLISDAKAMLIRTGRLVSHEYAVASRTE